MHEARENHSNPKPMSSPQPRRPVRVGFDLDGVLFFNPLRVVRRPIELVKKHILKKNTVDFYIPKSSLEKLIWKIAHMSSIRPASGWQKIRELTEAGLIEPYLITARFECLKNDFARCKSRISADDYFAGTHHNSKDEQPHLFKERMVKELDIQYFVEDNWNIVNHLSKNTNTKVIWISNVVDQDIQFEERVFDLSSAMKRLSELVVGTKP